MSIGNVTNSNISKLGRWYAWFDAAKNGDLETAGILLKTGFDVNTTEQTSGPSWSFDPERTALHHAVLNGQDEFVEFLLKNGADPNPRSRNTPLHNAVEKDNLPLVKLLLRFKANANAEAEAGLNVRGQSPFHLAVQKGNQVIIGELIKGGANVNQPFDFWASPQDVSALHLSARNDLQTTQLLVNHGANLFAATRYYHELPIHWAIKNKTETVADFLLEKILEKPDLPRLLPRLDQKDPFYVYAWNKKGRFLFFG